MGQYDRLELTEDEAYALLALCMTSDMALEAQSEQALKKLADFCRTHRNSQCRHVAASSELMEAG